MLISSEYSSRAPLGPEGFPILLNLSKMAQELGQSHFPLPHFPISSSASPSSSEHDSLFSPPPANSAITTPSVTPDRDLVRPGATGQSNQKLAVERVDARPENSQHEEPQPQPQPQHYTLTQPPTQSTRFRPYPPEMYAQGHAPSVYAPSQAYPMVPYIYPGGMPSYQPSMVQPGMGMVPGQFSSPPPDVYAPPQHMGPYAPYSYAPYIAPAPQAINPAVSYTFPLTQALPAPGPVTQTAMAVAHPAQAEGMMYTCPTADATYFYNLGLMHSTLGYVQSVGNDGQPIMQPPAPQQQQYPQTQGYVPTDIYAAMGQQIVSSNAGSVQQAVPAASSSVRRKWKHRIMNDGPAAKPKIHPVINDPDFVSRFVFLFHLTR